MKKCNCEFSEKCQREISPYYRASDRSIVCDSNYKGSVRDAERKAELIEKKYGIGLDSFEMAELAHLAGRGSFC